ncbi:hypothetical protein B9G69_008215 [Bdellovibrio sp. SKB1291214]|uniref:hypothetical protein n=1 Tax=Bdellovibrio sp. SKB1291214 TaxID=1732569 RepID=UPI0015962857|nr:hypothetical protein [Bdellovibrio sp. SKB1291214]UYL10558.1 hypothetical protein B9G69_008215 [Bdellovibrio sp. SKB1291214]
MRIIAAILIIFTFAACSKPDPNPELKDPIYSDLQTKVGAATAALEAEKKKLEGFQKDMEAVVPQTGQIKYAQKRLYESQANITRLEQELEYLKLKVEQRLKTAQSSYKKAYAKKEEWPDPKEYSSYLAEEKLRNAKRSWDVKQRMKDAGVSFDTGIGKAGGGEGGAEGHGGGEKAEGGGH